jgi:SOS-response transcriptional repressor LexA
LDITSIWRYENGRRHPSSTSLFVLAHVYGKEIEYFWGENPDVSGAPKDRGLDLDRANIRGTIGSGGLVGDWDQELGSCQVPSHWLQLAPRAFALRVSGNSLASEGIREGDIVLVDPDSSFEDGKIYIVLLQKNHQSITSRRVYTSGRLKYKLVNVDGSVEEVDRRTIQILGRMRWSLREY